MGDDIGIMQASTIIRGFECRRTPNIDRIGMMARSHDLLRRAKLHRWANGLLHRHASIAHGNDPPQLPAPVLAPAPHPAVAKFCSTSATPPENSARITLGDHVEAASNRAWFQEFWGYLYHLDAMQG